MSLDKATKKELIEVIEEQRHTIEKQQAEIRKEKDWASNARRRAIDMEEEVKQVRRQLAYSHHQNIADIKSLQNFLIIFSNETMTHNEKGYLARKINQVVEKLIEERIEGLDGLYSINDSMPF